MHQSRWIPPVWLMGLCNFPFGSYWAVMLITMPQLLAGNGVPEPQIASITAIGLIPTFCSFLLSPVLDWRFRRRSYAIVFAGVAALMLFAALTFIHQLRLMTLLLFVGATAVTLYGAALGGWLGS